MNEIMILGNKTNLDFSEVIRLAKTKWNFLNLTLDYRRALFTSRSLLFKLFANKYGFRTKLLLLEEI